MTYQPCRWYDPYPRLAFALKLLYLAPAELRGKAIQNLSQFLGLKDKAPQPIAQGNRWYDSSREMTDLVEHLKTFSDPLKDVSADKLLETLDRIAS